MLISYLRPCDEPGTELGAHRRALADAGCGRVVKEPLGAEDGGAQPELDGLLGRLQPGDVLVVPQLNSLARSLPDLVRTLQCVVAAGAGLRSVAEAVDAGASREAAPSVPDTKADAALSDPTLHDDRGKPKRVNASLPAAPPPLRRRRGRRPPKPLWQQTPCTQRAVHTCNKVVGVASAA